MGSRLRDTRKSKRARKQIARMLRNLRTHGIGDIGEAARLAGVGHMTWRRWESGESSIPAERLPQLAKILDCSIMDLLGTDIRLSDLAHARGRELERESIAKGVVAADTRTAAERTERVTLSPCCLAVLHGGAHSLDCTARRLRDETSRALDQFEANEAAGVPT